MEVYECKFYPFAKFRGLMPEKWPLFLDFANWRLPLKKNTPFSRKWVRAWYMLWSGGAWGGVVFHDDISMASCQRGPTRHAYAWQIGPFWQDTLDISQQTDPMSREASMKEEPDCSMVNTMPGGDHIQMEASENEHDSDGQKALSSTHSLKIWELPPLIHVNGTHSLTWF